MRTFDVGSSRRVARHRLALAAAFSVVGLGACADGSSPVGARHEAVISDQLHGGGTAGFVWLPPMVPNLPGRDAGDFVPDLDASVRIDEIDAAGHTLRSLATFTGSAGPQRERLRVHRQGDPPPDSDGDTDPTGYYLARWNTANEKLSLDATYRVRVLVPASGGGTRELGFADVRVVRDAGAFLGIDREEYTPLVNRSVLRVKFRIDRPAIDRDGDGVVDWRDNCPATANADQQDTVGNGIGDACRCDGVVCAAADSCHDAGVCRGTTGTCTQPELPAGTACPLPNAIGACANGTCTLAACDPGAGDCDQQAADGCETTLTSSTDCGACGNTCASGAHGTGVCTDGTCGLACADGYGDCNHDATDGCEEQVVADPINCGACGNVCAPPHAVPACTAGACGIAACEDGWADCDGLAANGCEQDIAGDVGNCGACGVTCAPADAVPACNAGQCEIAACAPEHANCDGGAADGCEVDLTADAGNCGACGSACAIPNAAATCSAGTCELAACDAGFANCDGAAGNGCEADLGSIASCGACGNVCAAGPHSTATCTAGGCGLACDPGFSDCNGLAADGCEVDLAADEAHCGACATACGASETCEAGACTAAGCTAPLADCDGAAGCEVDTSTDVANCGACGAQCSFPHAAEECTGGACGWSVCDLGYADCDGLPADGCEISLQDDEQNCGACGHACGAGSTCVNGACTYGCYGSANDAITGQKCPIETPCSVYAQCGTQVQGKYWYCSPTNQRCEFLPQSNGFTTAAGTCTGQLVVKQLSNAPWDKKILAPNGVEFRSGTSLAIQVTNTTITALYLDQIPLTLELAGTNPSQFDVNSIVMYQVGSISDYGDGNNGSQFVCSSPTTPFGSGLSFTLGTGATGGCGGSSFSRIAAGASVKFIINLTFSASKTFITNRNYRLHINPLTTVKARTSTAGTAASYTACTLPATGFSGAYLKFASP